MTIITWKIAQQNPARANILEMTCVSYFVRSYFPHYIKLYIGMTAEADAELKHEYITEHHLYRDDAYIPCSKPEHLRLDSFGATSETESEYYKSGGLETPDGRLLYRHYIERALKSKGLRKMLRYVSLLILKVSALRINPTCNCFLVGSSSSIASA